MLQLWTNVSQKYAGIIMCRHIHYLSYFSENSNIFTFLLIVNFGHKIMVFFVRECHDRLDAPEKDLLSFIEVDIIFNINHEVHFVCWNSNI